MERQIETGCWDSIAGRIMVAVMLVVDVGFSVRMPAATDVRWMWRGKALGGARLAGAEQPSPAVLLRQQKAACAFYSRTTVSFLRDITMRNSDRLLRLTVHSIDNIASI